MNHSAMPVPQQFEWTRVNTLQFIITLQAYPALWKVKLLWHPAVIFNILCVQLKRQFLTNCCKLLLRTNQDFVHPFFLYLFFVIFFQYKQRCKMILMFFRTVRGAARHTNTLPLCILQQNCRRLFTPRRKKLRGERTKSGAEIMTSQDGCRCEL